MADQSQSSITDGETVDRSSPDFTRRSSSVSLLNASQHSESARLRQGPASSGGGAGGGGQQATYGSINNPRPILRNKARSPDKNVERQRRPAGPRHMSSMRGPHRGQEFSVDDAAEEVDEDMQRSQPPPLSRGQSTLRRQPSTLKRTRSAVPPPLPRVVSRDEDDRPQSAARPQTEPAEEPEPEEEEAESEADEEDGDDDDDDNSSDVSDAESFTLKDRQEAINETHPFGIRIWKPALYKKDRSVQRNAEGDIHSTPGGFVSRWLFVFNCLWTILFGWWLAIAAFLPGLLCLLLGAAPGCYDYGQVFLGLAGYVLYPFGRYVKLDKDEAYLEEDEGEGRSITEYEQWQSGDIEEGRLFFGPMDINRTIVGRRRASIESQDESSSLLGRSGRQGYPSHRRTTKTVPKRRYFGRGKWDFGRIVFFVFFYFLITPLLLFVSGICWLLVFSIPMGKVTLLLWYHLRRHPLSLSFHSPSATMTRVPGSPRSAILLCTYRAVGLRYWKYTIDGTNIFLINLLGVVFFVVFDYFVILEALGINNALTSDGLIFLLGILSVIPLAYFIGQAVASISAQSTMGVGATINAFFSTVVEVFLYCVALQQGKAQLVEGSIIGSVFAGILLLPGLSMCFGALKRKTQRFNVKSAGVTSTMLLFAVIGAFGPTLFYQIYGSHELNCHDCSENDQNGNADRDCRRCYVSQAPAVHSKFYLTAVRPFIWFCAVMLFLSYVTGLLFTLRTHAATIWNEQIDEKRAAQAEDSTPRVAMEQSMFSEPRPLGTAVTATPYNFLSRTSTARGDIRDSQIYKRILGQSLKTLGMPSSTQHEASGPGAQQPQQAPADGSLHLPPAPADGAIKSPDQRSTRSMRIEGLSEESNRQLVRQVAEMAATAAAVAAHDVVKPPGAKRPDTTTHHRPATQRQGTFIGPDERDQQGQHEAGHGAAAPGGHDAPNWSRKKSAAVLLTATLAYAAVAEILVNTVDAVLDNVDIDEKFLGITLFAIVPNITEFLNGISFAMNGNIALSMEIGSAYALQVCLLQVPCLVLFSAIYGQFVAPDDIIDHTFTLIFPQWDMVTVILCVFLLSYMYGEGKSNYFKGSILILSYLVVVMGFYLSGYNNVEVESAAAYASFNHRQRYGVLPGRGDMMAMAMRREL